MMLTGHIMGAEIVLINEQTWQGFDADTQNAILEAAAEVRQYASHLMLDQEDSDLAALKEAGMTVIGPDDGLQIDAFRTSCQQLVQERFAEDYGALYAQIAELA
jgi:TRAP-type transport system periplasmic protein